MLVLQDDCLKPAADDEFGRKLRPKVNIDDKKIDLWND